MGRGFLVRRRLRMCCIAAALLIGCFGSDSNEGFDVTHDGSVTDAGGSGRRDAGGGDRGDAGAGRADAASGDVPPGGACGADADCAAPASACTRAACLGGRCEEVQRAQGTVLDAARQQAGDCVQLVCDGAGAITEEADATDVPASEGPCSTPRCDGARAVQDPLPDGAPVADADQVAGDCQRLVCDGAGGTRAEPEPTDRPTADDACSVGSCDGATPRFAPLPEGARCGTDQVCDADGNCITCGVTGADACPNIAFDAVDMLFMVDNSGTMREEQLALAAQFPRLIEVLTSGDRDLDGIQDFPAVTDLHLGVVSSDMGLIGIPGIPTCGGTTGLTASELGDDGLLHHTPSPTQAGCQTSYPEFLSYRSGLSTPAQVATDFGCIATLGTDGCGFEQQLESTLKALWPASDPGVEFLQNALGEGGLGHGDGANAGFLRSDPPEGPSLLTLVIVSDENDCSAHDTRIFTPDVYLDPSDPLAAQDLNMRCFLNPDALYPVARYIDAFRALRSDVEPLVIFSAIVGVPPDLVTPAALAGVDFADTTEREAFYEALLADPRMVERPDPDRPPEQGQNLAPVCTTPSGKAYPGTRFVEVARAFGPQGVVQSICQDDFTPAMDALIDAIVARR